MLSGAKYLSLSLSLTLSFSLFLCLSAGLFHLLFRTTSICQVPSLIYLSVSRFQLPNLSVSRSRLSLSLSLSLSLTLSLFLYRSVSLSFSLWLSFCPGLFFQSWINSLSLGCPIRAQPVVSVTGQIHSTSVWLWSRHLFSLNTDSTNKTSWHT